MQWRDLTFDNDPRSVVVALAVVVGAVAKVGSVLVTVMFPLPMASRAPLPLTAIPPIRLMVPM